MAQKIACPRCPKTFRTESGRDWHLERAHEGDTAPPEVATAQTPPTSREAAKRIEELEFQLGELEDLVDSLSEETSDLAATRARLEEAEKRAQELEAARHEAAIRLQIANDQLTAKTAHVAELEEQIADAQKWFAAQLAQTHPAGLCQSQYCGPCQDARASVTRAATENLGDLIYAASEEFFLRAEHGKVVEATRRYLNGERLASLTVRITR